METRKTLKKLVKDYKLIFSNLGFKINPNFDKDFLHIKRMQTNSTQISYIKKDKIEGLEKNVPDFKLKPNDSEQRKKYFSAVRPSKFLASLVLQPKDSKAQLFMQITEQFNKDFLNNIKNKLVLYSGDDIATIYNSASVVGCMAKSCKSWFKVYAKTENLQLATLQDSETILMRSLLWYDKETNNYWLDNTYEQSSINGDNEIRKEYQKKLICQVLEHIKETKIHSIKGTNLDFKFGCRFAGCLDSNILQEIEKKYDITIYKDVQRTKDIRSQEIEGTKKFKQVETDESKNCVSLKPIIKDFDICDFDNFPYSDTFRSIGRDSGKWFLNCNEGNSDFVCCQSQNGDDENNNLTSCDEDYIYYSDYEDEYLCDDCSVYVDERDVSVRRENASYNDYSNTYHVTDDISQC